MARLSHSRGLSAGAPAQVELATPAHDAAIRALLRRNPMGGAIRLSFEREPSALEATAVEGHPQAVVVARASTTGQIVGMGSRAVMNVYLNGAPRRVGYLSLLRLDQAFRGRVRLLRDGYALLREQRRPDEEAFDLTSVLADNTGARRLLEAGLPGFPAYRPLDRMITFVLEPSRAVARSRAPRVQLERASEFGMPEIATFLDKNNRRFQLARRFTSEDLRATDRSRGLHASDFHIARVDGALVGCAALWDQRSFKQVVVQGYGRALARLRPLLNLAAPILRIPSLPEPGQRLDLAFVSHVAVDGDDPDVFRDLLASVLADARARGIRYVVTGLSASHPLLPTLRCFRVRQYESILYATHWGEEGASATSALDGRPLHVEVGLL